MNSLNTLKKVDVMKKICRKLLGYLHKLETSFVMLVKFTSGATEQRWIGFWKLFNFLTMRGL